MIEFVAEMCYVSEKLLAGQCRAERLKQNGILFIVYCLLQSGTLYTLTPPATTSLTLVSFHEPGFPFQIFKLGVDI